jgi:uncharacterized protein
LTKTSRNSSGAKLHILDARGPREITDVSAFVGGLAEKKQFTRYYFERESDRERARRRKKGGDGMKEREDVVTAVVAAAGGQLAGRVRLQKTVHLLDRLGLGSGFDYEYHHYGPYSRDLDNATADAKAFKLVDETFEHRVSDGAMYSIFRLAGEPKDDAYGELGRERTAELVRDFARTNITVLELAATVDWLWREERYADWQSEITRRKGIKVQGGRLEKALALLSEIGLATPEPATT